MRRIALLAVVATCLAAAPPQNDTKRIEAIIAAGTQYNVPAEDVSKAITDGTPADDFIARASGSLVLVVPKEAITGQPVQILVDGLPDAPYSKMLTYNQQPADKLLELFNAAGDPVTVFWSTKPGPRTFKLIVAVNGDPAPVFTTADAMLDYGPPEPEPTPPLPPTPEPTPTPTPANWQFAFMVPDTQETLPQSQQEVLASLTLREELESAGNYFAGLFDATSTQPIESMPENDQGWYVAMQESNLKPPLLELAPLDGGDIRVFKLPIDKAALLKLLKEGHE